MYANQQSGGVTAGGETNEYYHTGRETNRPPSAHGTNGGGPGGPYGAGTTPAPGGPYGAGTTAASGFNPY